MTEPRSLTPDEQMMFESINQTVTSQGKSPLTVAQFIDIYLKSPEEQDAYEEEMDAFYTQVRHNGPRGAIPNAKVTSSLLFEMSNYYRDFLLKNGIAKLFSWVDQNNHQYLLMTSWLNEYADMDSPAGRELEDDFLRYIVQKYDAKCYSRTSMWAQEGGLIEVGVLAVEKDSPTATMLYAPAQFAEPESGDTQRKIASIGEYKASSGDRDKLALGWLFNDKKIEDKKIAALEVLLKEMEPRMVNRPLPIPEK